MKKFLFASILALFVGTTFSTVKASLLDDAIAWAYTKGLTRYYTPDYFLPNNSIRRDEASKFFVNFAKLVGKTTYIKTTPACQFSDTQKAISDLQEYVIESCRLGIFNGAYGNFYPADNLTNAEAIAVLIRIISGLENESGLSHWANNYYNRANILGLLDNVKMSSKDSVASRGNVISILYEAKNSKGTSTNYSYSWEYWNRGKCSTTCGGGTQTREVRCERNNEQEVSDSYCSETKPATSQHCNTQSCQSSTTNDITQTFHISTNTTSFTTNEWIDLTITPEPYTFGVRFDLQYKQYKWDTRSKATVWPDKSRDEYYLGYKFLTDSLDPIFLPNFIQLKSAGYYRLTATNSQDKISYIDLEVIWGSTTNNSSTTKEYTNTTNSRYPWCDTNNLQVGSKIIASCNVWANKAGTGSTSFWDYFQQWKTTNELTNGWQSDKWDKDNQWPCKTWYHVPTIDERRSVTNYFTDSHELQNALLLPGADYLYSNGFHHSDLYPEYWDGYYWTSNQRSTLELDGVIRYDGESQESALSVRCFKD